MKPTKRGLWCVYNSDGTPSTIGETADEAIRRHMDWIRGGFTWPELYRRGVRCRPVSLTVDRERELADIRAAAAVA